jgi:hypothetical protein
LHVAGALAALAAARSWSVPRRIAPISGIVAIAPDSIGGVPSVEPHISSIAPPVLVIKGAIDCVNSVESAEL